MATAPIFPDTAQTGDIPVRQTVLAEELVIPFDAWMDEQLEELESQFGEFITADSQKEGLGR